MICGAPRYDFMKDPHLYNFYKRNLGKPCDLSRYRISYARVIFEKYPPHLSVTMSDEFHIRCACDSCKHLKKLRPVLRLYSNNYFPLCVKEVFSIVFCDYSPMPVSKWDNDIFSDIIDKTCYPRSYLQLTTMPKPCFWPGSTVWWRTCSLLHQANRQCLLLMLQLITLCPCLLQYSQMTFKIQQVHKTPKANKFCRIDIILIMSLFVL